MQPIASTKAFNLLTAGTAIADARALLGIRLLAGGDAATVKVYKGAAATPGKEVGLAAAAAGLTNSDDPTYPCSADDGTSAVTHGLFVVITGTAPAVLIRYST